MEIASDGALRFSNRNADCRCGCWIKSSGGCGGCRSDAWEEISNPCRAVQAHFVSSVQPGLSSLLWGGGTEVVRFKEEGERLQGDR